MYTKNCRSVGGVQRVSDSVYVSSVKISLGEYVQARQAYCCAFHKAPCSTCSSMLSVAERILNEGYLPLVDAFSIVSPNTKYTAEKARRNLLQMPLVTIRVGTPASGNSFILLLQHFYGADYSNISTVMNGMASSLSCDNKPSLQRSCVQMLLSLAQSDRERECIRYGIYKASGVTATQARRVYGFQGMSERATRVEEAIHEVQQIRETIDTIASIQQDKVLYATFGIVTDSEESISSTCSSDEDENVSCIPCEITADTLDMCKQILVESKFNWFCVQEELENKLGEDAASVLEKLIMLLPNLAWAHKVATRPCKSVKGCMYFCKK